MLLDVISFLKHLFLLYILIHTGIAVFPPMYLNLYMLPLKKNAVRLINIGQLYWWVHEMVWCGAEAFCRLHISTIIIKEIGLMAIAYGTQ